MSSAVTRIVLKYIGSRHNRNLKGLEIEPCGTPQAREEDLNLSATTEKDDLNENHSKIQPIKQYQRERSCPRSEKQNICLHRLTSKCHWSL